MKQTDIDKIICGTIVDCADRFSSPKMMSILYCRLFGKWAYEQYDIIKDDIIDTARPYNETPAFYIPKYEIDLEEFHDRIINLGYFRCTLDYDDIYINIDEEIILLLTNRFIHCIGCFGGSIPASVYAIQQCIQTLEVEDDKAAVGIMMNNNGTYIVNRVGIDKIDIDVSKTYNDDLPEEAIENFIENEINGLALFYGEPGTGKSTYIRHLIQKYPDKNFVILDSNLLYNITSQSLLNEFISNKNAIYIIEDCEKLLVSRNVEQNPIMSTFLNMTDGITALMINCKFICTFNTELKNIDEALRRKGRMKLEYKFNKLSKDKVKKILGNKYDEDMTIADVMYANDKINFSEKKKTKIGFQ